jgi:signal transduction protein with GAF and PtsI domain
MKGQVGTLWALMGIGFFILSFSVSAEAADKQVSGGTVIKQTQEAVIATKVYTIQQKDAFQRKVQAELEEIQVHITKLRGQVNHASTEARTDIQKAIAELEKKRDLAKEKAEDIHSATASSWEQVKSKTAAAMDDLRDSVNRTLSHLP